MPSSPPAPPSRVEDATRSEGWGAMASPVSWWKGSQHPKRGGFVMGMDDKVGNKAEQASGKVKETVGKATDNESMQGEGRRDQSKAKLKDAKEDVKSALDK